MPYQKKKPSQSVEPSKKKERVPWAYFVGAFFVGIVLVIGFNYFQQPEDKTPPIDEMPQESQQIVQQQPKEETKNERQSQQQALDTYIKNNAGEELKTTIQPDDHNPWFDDHRITAVKVDENYHEPTLFLIPPRGYDYEQIRETLDNTTVTLAIGNQDLEQDVQALVVDYAILNKQPNERYDMVGFYYDGQTIKSTLWEGENIEEWLAKQPLNSNV